MTQEEIKKILPHRDKMLLVDEAELCRILWTKTASPPAAAAATPSGATSGFCRGTFPETRLCPAWCSAR